ncbi:hypothetical protein ACFE04_000617 [Oxalis oulophora]
MRPYRKKGVANSALVAIHCAIKNTQAILKVTLAIPKMVAFATSLVELNGIHSSMPSKRLPRCGCVSITVPDQTRPDPPSRNTRSDRSIRRPACLDTRNS